LAGKLDILSKQKIGSTNNEKHENLTDGPGTTKEMEE